MQNIDSYEIRKIVAYKETILSSCKKKRFEISWKSMQTKKSAEFCVFQCSNEKRRLKGDVNENERGYRLKPMHFRS